MRDLSAILSDPASLDSMSPEEAAEALAQLARVHAELAARLGARQHPVTEHRPPSSPDRLLTPVEVAERMGVTTQWLYRHAKTFKFTKPLSRKTLRFSEAGLTQYLSRLRVEP